MIGNILLTAGLLAAIFTAVMYYLTYKGYVNTLKLARIGYHTTAISIIASSALLLHAILTHQYQYEYVFSYSGSGLPTGLLMSTFYAGQEGSFLLWTLFTAIVGLILLEYTSKRGDLEPRVMMVFSLTAIFLLVMVSPLLKSPFTYIWAEATFIDIKYINQAFFSMPFMQNFIFTDPDSQTSFVKMSSDLYATLVANNISINEFIIQGKGLNPLLQNFWMQIHPPFLFVGFAMSAVPFSFAISSLIKNEYREWIKQSLPWVLAGTMVLGFAIMLGGYWAYGVLGWGGYWGWDPVENSSLVPWIIGVASIHTLLVQKKTQSGGATGRFGKTNLILCILSFVLVMYSTFLTRSGILGDASVHSFVAPGMIVFLFLLGFLILFALMGIGGIIYRWKSLTAQFDHEENLLSRELALFTGSVALIASALIILVGTSAPMIGQTVELRFYNELNLPIAIIIGLLNGFSLLLKWKFSDKKNIWKESRNSLIATLVLTLLIVLIGKVYDLMLIIFTLSAAFTLTVNLEIALKILRGRKTHLGGYIAHTGIALFMLGVIATGGFTEDQKVDLVKGEKTKVLGYDLVFTGYTPFEDGKKYAFNIDVIQGNSKSTVSPVMYIAEFNNSLMREPDILNQFTKDFYISPLGYDDKLSADATGNAVLLNKGETKNINGVEITFEQFNFPKDAMSSMMAGGEFFIGADLKINYNGKSYDAEPGMKKTGDVTTYDPVEIPDANLKLQLRNLNAAGSIELIVSSLTGSTPTETGSPKEILSIEASVKPFINLVWAGIVVMVLGFLLSIIRRTKEAN
ncbi:MAG: cytochrome c-type biogenesis CcmF C-terminal domain-containing protein [bacterium]